MVSEAYFHPFPIAVLFATTISRFDDVLRSTPTCVEKLHLSTVKLRLTRWGEAVGAYPPNALEGNPRADPEDIQEVKDTLVKLISLFDCRVPAHKRSSSDTSRLSTPINQTLIWQSVEALDCQAIEALHSTMENISRLRSRGAPSPITSTIASAGGQDPAPQETLADAASTLISALELCYPAAAERRRQCRHEMEALVGTYGPTDMVAEMEKYASWQPTSSSLSDKLFSLSIFATVVGNTVAGAHACVCM